ncbi:hypothetical protein F5884DRAFT_849695 [Xylogone sp. PMI_703]|nr:hypothetical protein F5884DRAFT_849695 [Xylogone sp. PMI_703]
MSADAIVVEAPKSDNAPNVGLSSPPESNPALEVKMDTSDSELSDIEDPEDDLADVEPAFWADDGHIPVFKPTPNQFKSFPRYMDKINPWGMRSGIVKIIPPNEWREKLPPLDEAIKKIKIKEPIKQDIMGTSGTYRQANIVHQRSYNLPQWRQLCEQSEHQPPARRGERRANHDKPPRPAPKPKADKAPSNATQRKRGRPSRGKRSSLANKTEDAGTPDRLPTPVSPTVKAEDDVELLKLEVDEEEDSPVKGRCGSVRQEASVSSRRKYNRREVANRIDEEAFKNFRYQLDEEFSPERCEELERVYWKTLTYAPPLYGADMPGSLFDDRTTEWNLGRLENILDVMGAQIPGVNTAYLYLGMWKATFAWHLEDVDLYSINFLHFGAPKQWYSISQGDARRFEDAMKSIWPVDAKACDQFLRHKTFLISPSHLLQNYNIRVNKIVHHPGEFIVTYPYGYHSGYNLGYNCAEAVNFALESWIEYGRVAKKCECSQAQDSVWIDVRELERKWRGEETDYDETDEEEEEDGPHDLPTPPESSGDAKPKAPLRKRKRTANDGGEASGVKKLRLRLKAPAKEPCVLCPNDIPSEPLLATEDGQKAHRLCALYIPETSIEPGEQEVVIDIKYIDKARLELKCNYCRSKKGACFQCSHKKCTRAYHATCAAAAGVFVEEGEIPVFSEDGTEYKDHAIEFSCRFHRVKREKKLDSDALDEDERIRKAAAELKVGDVCQMQYFKGDIFAGAVVENRKSEEIVLVDILPRGDRVEVEYKWLLIPDPADYRLPKPSAKAIPMPRSFKAKESLNTSKRQLHDDPRADDPFTDGCTWAEFRCEKISPNPAQVKVDLSKENQIWYYLGKTSTEAKAQFTEDPSKPRHNPKGHFLDTIPKPVTSVPRLSYAASYPSGASQSASTGVANQQHQSPTITSIKSEKPYIYKPRIPADQYHVDSQAYRSQQNFVKQSTPYRYGTDPRFGATDTRPSNPYSGFSPSASHHPQSSPIASSGSSTPKPQAGPVPTASLANQQRPASYSFQSGRSSSQSSSSSSRNHSGRSGLTNPFEKYYYLQCQHNRSPLEYRSPYRPGHGFMNGYEGSFEKYVKNLTPAQLLEAEMRRKTQKLQSGSSGWAPSGSQSPGVAATTKAAPPSFNATLAKQQPLPPHQVTKSVQGSWERKDASQSHPATKQGHNSMFHRQYQPSQFQKPLMHTPATQEIRFPQINYQAQQLAASKNINPAPRVDSRKQLSQVPIEQAGNKNDSSPKQGQNNPAVTQASSSSVTGVTEPAKSILSEPTTTFVMEGKPLYPHQLPLKARDSQSSSEIPAYLHQQTLQTNTQAEKPDGLADVAADTATTVQHIMLNVRSRVEAYEHERMNK